LIPRICYPETVLKDMQKNRSARPAGPELLMPIGFTGFRFYVPGFTAYPFHPATGRSSGFNTRHRELQATNACFTPASLQLPAFTDSQKHAISGIKARSIFS
jgi:hypothetical protein